MTGWWFGLGISKTSSASESGAGELGYQAMLGSKLNAGCVLMDYITTVSKHEIMIFRLSSTLSGMSTNQESY